MSLTFDYVYVYLCMVMDVSAVAHVSRRRCQYQELKVVVSCLKRVMENPVWEKDAFYQTAISPTLCQWFVCETVGLAHVYGPSLWGVQCQVLCLCDHLSNRKPRQEGALWLMVSVVPACCGKEKGAQTASRNRTIQAQGLSLMTSSREDLSPVISRAS